MATATNDVGGFEMPTLTLDNEAVARLRKEWATETGYARELFESEVHSLVSSMDNSQIRWFVQHSHSGVPGSVRLAALETRWMSDFVLSHEGAFNRFGVDRAKFWDKFADALADLDSRIFPDG